MKYIAPSYYGSFQCIAGDCSHSCCAGWEIDIDEESLQKYRSMEGKTGELLRQNIDLSGETPCFRMTEGERCPFLNEKGLCELILAEGPDVLCQICADHPRFRNFYLDREEIGLGMCCEAAGRLILTWPDRVSLHEVDDDGFDDPSDEAEEALLALRDRLIRRMQDRSLTAEERVSAMLKETGVSLPGMDYPRWAEYLMSLERLDDQWLQPLATLRDAAEADESRFEEPEWEIAFEQLMVYLLYRHLPNAMQDGNVEERLAFVALMWRILRRMCAATNADMEGFVQLCRMYSSEIEYSDVNVDEIMEELRFRTDA